MPIAGDPSSHLGSGRIRSVDLDEPAYGIAARMSGVDDLGRG